MIETAKKTDMPDTSHVIGNIDDTQGFLSPVRVMNKDSREQAIQRLCAQIMDVARIAEVEGPERSAALRILEAHLPRILHMAKECPFSDVRSACVGLLRTLRKHYSVPVPKTSIHCVSVFIEKSTFEADGGTNRAVLQEAFCHDGRVSHMIRLMGQCPQFIAPFLRSQHYVMRGDGPLQRPYRCYLAIMAAARHDCQYLIDIWREEFTACGGNREWLQGISKAPVKLQSFANIVALLAHQPWRMTVDDIKAIARGKDSWSIGEVVHAITIIAHIHALSSFCLGLGVSPEIDSARGHSMMAPSEASTDSPTITTEKDVFDFSPTIPEAEVYGAILSMGATISDDRFDKLVDILKEVNLDDEDVDEDANETAFEAADIENPVDESTKFNLPQFCPETDIKHEDFDVANDEYSIFRGHDFSWEDHGFSIVSRFYPDAAPLLDEEFTQVTNMTDRSIGDRFIDIDTSQFRWAIWFYIHRIYGILHDDYNYHIVNQILEKDLKKFIKKAVFYPEAVTKDDFTKAMRDFRVAESVHIVALICDAKKVAGMLYGLERVMRYMT